MFFLVIFFVLFLLLLWYVFIFEPYHLRIEEPVIKIKNLPGSFEGVKIIHLSDLHSKNFGYREKKILEMIDGLKPDFIFITGDFMDRFVRDRDIKSCREFWRELSQRCRGKTYGVLGNHGHKVNVRRIGPARLKNFLRESGIVILNNENRKLERGNEYIYLIGVDDPHTAHDDFTKASRSIDAHAPKILLSHSSEIMGRIGEESVNLILSGHTHGGQVKIPFVRAFWIPTKYHGRYARGLFKIKSTYLYVNRGVGTDLLPIRFNALPELTLIELRKTG